MTRIGDEHVRRSSRFDGSNRSMGGKSCALLEL